MSCEWDRFILINWYITCNRGEYTTELYWQLIKQKPRAARAYLLLWMQTWKRRTWSPFLFSLFNCQTEPRAPNDQLEPWVGFDRSMIALSMMITPGFWLLRWRQQAHCDYQRKDFDSLWGAISGVQTERCFIGLRWIWALSLYIYEKSWRKEKLVLIIEEARDGGLVYKVIINYCIIKF